MAVYYTSLAGNFAYPNYLTYIRAFGGDASAAARDGDPGTVYLKDKAKTYGDLIAYQPSSMNSTLSTSDDAWGTRLYLPSGTSTALTATVLTSGSTFMEAGIETNNLVGLANPGLTAASTLFRVIFAGALKEFASSR